MRITPIEIRQRQFEKKFRGFDIDEVSAFLNTLSNEWERLVDENKELKKRFEAAEREVSKMREVESSLFRTLKTAEETGNNIVDQANKKAELLVKEAQSILTNSEKEAQEKAQKLKEDATLNARNIIDSAKEELAAAEKELREIETKKLSIIDDLKKMAEDIHQKIDKYTRPTKIDLYYKLEPEEETESTKREVTEPTVSAVETFTENEILTIKTEESEFISNEQTFQSSPANEQTSPEPEFKIDPNKGSFFDQI
ncbi:MAG: DivIVA domain-containing protein [Cytophagales bacterium]